MAEENNSRNTTVRRIKASGADSNSTKATPTRKKTAAKTTAKSSPKTASTLSKSTAKKPTAKQPAKSKTFTKSKSKPFFLFRPFIGFGRYVRNSWRELRQVRWTNRRATWGLTLAVILFSAFFAVFILFFDWIFNWLIKEVIL